MEYVRLGDSGLQVSRLALGMLSVGDPAWRPWILDETAAKSLLRAAAEAGVTFFDTADVYSGGAGEAVAGRLLREFFPRREDYVLATKVGMPVGPRPNDRGLSRKHIMASIDASLRRLGVEYVDIYQVHRFDPGTPVEETVCALDDVVRAGKARSLGASTMYAWQFAKLRHAAARHGGATFVSMQNLYNLAYREEEREMIPFCLDAGVAVLPYSPLHRGLLATTREAPATRSVRARTDQIAVDHRHPHDTDVLAAVQEVAGARGVPPAQASLAWLWHQRGVTAPVMGATRPAHIRSAAEALSIRLAPEELARLAAPYRPRAVLGVP